MKTKERVYYVGIKREGNKAIMFFCQDKDCLPSDLFKYLGFFKCKVNIIKQKKYTMLRTINQELNADFQKLEYVFN